MSQQKLEFFEGLAVKEKDGKWFHVKKNGKPAYAERYDMAEYFQMDRGKILAWVKKGNEWFRINKNGKIVNSLC
jgi:hypothetical protein